MTIHLSTAWSVAAVMAVDRFMSHRVKHQTRVALREVLRAPEDVAGLAAVLAGRTAAAAAAQLSRLDTAYRTFAAAVRV